MNGCFRLFCNYIRRAKFGLFSDYDFFSTTLGFGEPKELEFGEFGEEKVHPPKN